MKELTDRALNLAQVQGATYADMRIVRHENQTAGDAKEGQWQRV